MYFLGPPAHIYEDIGMNFGMDRCAIVAMEKGQVARTVDSAANGERMRTVDEDGYKYLGILQLDDVLNTDMKDKIKKECGRRIKLVLRSQLNAGNFIAAINSWAVDVVRYGAGVLKWNQMT